MVLVIGIGNEMRGDDAVGLLAARHIAAEALAGVCVRECAGETAGLIEAWRGVERVYVIDCCAPMGEPGRIHRFDPRAAALPETVKTISSHGAGLGMAIELARALDALPAALTVFAIEGAEFGHGATPGPQVAGAARAVADLIASDIRAEAGAVLR